MSLDSLMDRLVTLERITVQQSGVYAEAPPRYSVDGAAQLVPVSIQPSSASTRLYYMQRGMRCSHTMYFDRDWNPNTRDRWVLQDNTRTRYFVITGWYESLEIQDTWTCDCEEVKLTTPATEVF